MISAVVVTKNSEAQLVDCLISIHSLADEIIVIDLGSTDDTTKIAKEFGAHVIAHKHVEYVELIRQFAIDQTHGEWVIVMDPDERVTQTLAKKLLEITNTNVDAVNIPRKNVFFGTWVRHTNFWPDRQIRFFRKTAITWSTKIHSYPKVNGRTIDLPSREDLAIVHLGYSDYAEFFERNNRYSSVEAENLNSDGQKFYFANLLWKPTREFLARYIKHAGFLDGFLGLSLVYSLMIYQLTVQIKLWEKAQK